MPDIDHRTMTPPSLRITRHMSGPAGDQVFIWDLRLAQPNVSHVGMPVVHSFEHFLGTYLREMADYVVLAAPMGCQTGFYIVTMGMNDFDTLKQLIISALATCVNSSAIASGPSRCRACVMPPEVGTRPQDSSQPSRSASVPARRAATSS